MDENVEGLDVVGIALAETGDENGDDGVEEITESISTSEFSLQDPDLPRTHGCAAYVFIVSSSTGSAYLFSSFEARSTYPWSSLDCLFGSAFG